MKVSILQIDIKWAHEQQNISDVQAMMDASPGSDLYVLPEMWATGFITRPENIAKTESASEALAWMKSVAAERQCAVCGSLAVVDAEGNYRNRHYFIDGKSNTVHYYDKHHLFTYGHEDRYYTAGELPVIVSYMDFRILLLTCYDLRFPIWSRYGRMGEYDMTLLVANWPQPRMNAWHVLTRARAIENQCYFVAVNRVGADSSCRYVGGSAVISPTGKTLVQCRPGVPDVATVDVDIDSLQSMRDTFRVLADRDRLTD
jgi:predicted amidohydrolase